MILKKIFNAEYRAVLSFRVYSFVYCNISKMLGYILYNRAKLKYGCDIAPTAQIGKGFKIAYIGGIVIGDGCVIGANSVVIRSFGEDCIIVGVPAKRVHAT